MHFSYDMQYFMNRTSCALEKEEENFIWCVISFFTICLGTAAALHFCILVSLGLFTLCLVYYYMLYFFD